MHATTGCAQCHVQVTAVFRRATLRDDRVAGRLLDLPRETGQRACRASAHGRLAAAGDPNAPDVPGLPPEALDDRADASRPRRPSRRTSRAVRHAVTGKVRPARQRIDARRSRIVDELRDERARHGADAERTARDRDVHRLPRAHRQLPADDPESRVNANNIAATCGSAITASRSSSAPASTGRGRRLRHEASRTTRPARTATLRTRSAARTGTTSGC